MNKGPTIPLAIVGCDFRVAGARTRSRLVLDEQQALEIAAELDKGGWAHGLAFLDTCNRNEWIVTSDESAWAAQLLRGSMVGRLTATERRTVQPYVLVGEDAARHLFRVAIGQESLVVGERQIAGQFFRALNRARMMGTSCRVLNGLGSIAGRLVRIAIRRGCVRDSSIGVHSLAISWLRERLPSQGERTVVVVGMGSIGRRVAASLALEPRVRVVRCNRTVGLPSDAPGPAPVQSHDWGWSAAAPSAPDTDAEAGGRWSAVLAGAVQPLTRLPELLAQADAAIVCTAAAEPVVDGALLDPARGGVLVDIGIPEQVAHVGLPPSWQRIGLDELVAWRREQNAEGEGPSMEADELVERALTEFRRYCHEPAMASVMDLVRTRHRELATTELPRMMATHLSELPEVQRTRLESELRELLSGYTTEVLRAIRDASLQLPESEPWT